MQDQKPVKNAMDLSLGRKFHVESESEVKTPQILRPDPENEEKLPPIFFYPITGLYRDPYMWIFPR